jgi:Rrf2 family transcriptional regulator, cysteine metabolism repressor
MLKLSTKGRYGLRAMIDLAMAYTEQPQPIMMADIAKRQELSRKYLHALLTPLKNAGLVRSTRGAKGGYFLAKPPEEITVGVILVALEGELNIVDCLEETADCPRASQCLARRIWQNLNEAILEQLDNITLKNLVCNGTIPKEILS